MMSLTQLGRSLSYAFRGLVVVFWGEQSFRLQLFSAMIVILAAWWFHVSAFEWVILWVLIGTILSLELINSVFERIIDSFKPRIHPIVRDIKDIMAGAVLIMSIVAICVGVVIFAPYVTQLVRG